MMRSNARPFIQGRETHPAARCFKLSFVQSRVLVRALHGIDSIICPLRDLRPAELRRGNR